ncbi:MAG: DNA polymerase III subunit delta [Clostridiales bacterium]|nr:DNA polymerase III subunit delta [Clostridiales bacterium]
MDGIAFLNELAGGKPVGGAYYFCGEDPYSLNKGLRALVERTNPDLREMNTTFLKAPLPSDIQAAAETLPFFDDLRVVVAQEFDADTANALEDYVKTVPETTALLFVRPGKAPKTNPLYKAIDALGRAVSFNPLEPAQAQAFLQKRAKENGIPLDGMAAHQMIQYLGVDLGALENTLLMLGAYVGFGNRVTVQAVDACVKPSSEYEVFKIMDPLWAGNKREGIRILASLLSDPSESAIGLATLCERNVRGVLGAKQLLLDGKNEAQIAQILGMKPYPAKKAVASAKKRSYEQLVKMLDDFIAVEWKQKQGLAKAEDSLILACQQNF